MKKKLYTLILTLIVLFIGSICEAKDLKFIQVTDFHYTNSSTGDARLSRLVKNINSTKDLDFVIFTGDNIDSANPETLVKLLKAFRRIRVPYYIQIGNHDCFKAGGLDKKDYAKFVSKYSNQKLKNFNYVVKKDDVVFIFVDGMKEVIPAPSGYFKQDTLAWLEKQLKKYEKHPVVLVQHFPLINQRTNKPSGHDLFKVDEYYSVIKPYNNIIAVIAGHYHYNREEEANGIRHIVTQQASGLTPRYRIIYLQDEGKEGYSIMSQLVDF